MSFVLDKISSAHKVKDYLAQKGILPRTVSSDKCVYKCPLPGHNEKTPSFVVYDKGDKDDYFCFGCKENGGIINIYAALEGISIKEAILILSDGLDIDIQDNLNSLLDEIINPQEKVDVSDEALDFSFQISDAMYRYLRSTNFDPEELQIAEKLFQKLDPLIYTGNAQEIKEIRNALPQRLTARAALFREKEKQTEIEDVKMLQTFKEVK